MRTGHAAFLGGRREFRAEATDTATKPLYSVFLNIPSYMVPASGLEEGESGALSTVWETFDGGAESDGMGFGGEASRPRVYASHDLGELIAESLFEGEEGRVTIYTC